MIGYLNGCIKFKTSKSAILDINGVGYEVFLNETNLNLLNIGEQRELFIYTHVREDILCLYGFITLEQKKLFELFLSVNGIGPKSALEIVSIDIEELLQAILLGDVSKLQKVPGIGKKTAERIIIDLRDKISNFDFNKDVSKENVNKDSFRLDQNLFNDISEALINLGYDKRNFIEILNNLPKELEGAREEEVIKYCLRNL